MPAIDQPATGQLAGTGIPPAAGPARVIPHGTPVVYHGSLTGHHSEYVVTENVCGCPDWDCPGLDRYELLNPQTGEGLVHVHRLSITPLVPLPEPPRAVRRIPRRPHEPLVRVVPPGKWAVGDGPYLRQTGEWTTADRAYRIAKTVDTWGGVYFRLHRVSDDTRPVGTVTTLREVRDIILALRLTDGAGIRLDWLEGWTAYSPEPGVHWCRPATGT